MHKYIVQNVDLKDINAANNYIQKNQIDKWEMVGGMLYKL